MDELRRLVSLFLLGGLGFSVYAQGYHCDGRWSDAGYEISWSGVESGKSESGVGDIFFEYDYGDFRFFLKNRNKERLGEFIVMPELSLQGLSAGRSYTYELGARPPGRKADTAKLSLLYKKSQWSTGIDDYYATSGIMKFTVNDRTPDPDGDPCIVGDLDVSLKGDKGVVRVVSKFSVVADGYGRNPGVFD